MEMMAPQLIPEQQTVLLFLDKYLNKEKVQDKF